MTPAPPPAPVTIGRVRLETVIGRRALGLHPPSESAEAFMRAEVAPALGRALAGFINDGDEGFWVVRSVRAAVLAGSGQDGGRIAEALARTLGRRIQASCRPDNPGAVRFASRAEFLASFLVDLASGQAWERWHNAPFAHLRPLPSRQAAALAVEAWRDHGLAALAAMHRSGRMAAFLAFADPPLARRILAAVAAARADAGGIDPALADAAIDEVPGPARRGGRTRLTLAALAALAASAAGAEPAALRAAVEAAVERREAEARAGTDHGDDAATPPIVEAAQPGRPPAIQARRGRAKSHGRLRSGAGMAAVAAGMPPSASEQVGVFLLWRSVIETGVEAMLTRGATPLQAARRRLALAARLAGTGFAHAAREPELRWLAGLDELAGHEGLARPPNPSGEAERLSREAALAEARMLDAPQPLVLAVVADGAALAVVEARGGDWLALTRSPQRCREALAALAPLADALILPCGLAHLAPGSGGRPVAGPAGFELRGEPRHLDAAAALVPELRPLGADIGALGGGRGEAGLHGVLLARRACSDLARRMPGMARSSAAHILANAVRGRGSVRIGPEGGEAEATLPAVPYGPLLRMMGLDGAAYALADGRRVRLRLPGG